MSKTMTNGSRVRFHYGLEFAMNHSHEEIEVVIQKLETKQNRWARADRDSSKKSVRELQYDLSNGNREKAETELNRRFSMLRRLREKS